MRKCDNISRNPTQPTLVGNLHLFIPLFVHPTPPQTLHLNPNPPYPSSFLTRPNHVAPSDDAPEKQEHFHFLSH